MKRHALVSALSTVLALTAFAAPTAPAGASASTAESVSSETSDRQAAGRRVVSRVIQFEVVNHNETAATCLPAPDGRIHTVRARLIGPARVVEGRNGSETFHVLVHDAGTGGWFWNLQGRRVGREQQYAARLAEKGETVVVLDRLGYDRSPLRNGNATCLGAQATMLGRIVQALYAGLYEVPGRPRAARPHASHIVLHGHGTGATIVRLEAATYSDVQALVLMSPVTTSPSTLALQTLRGQGTVCLGGAGFAPYGETARSYRRLLFASAPAAVQRAAVRQRNSTPCGDVASLLPSVLEAEGQAVDVPTLVLSGRSDARRGGNGISATGGARLVRMSFAGAGSALPLEKQAPAVRRAVLSFVRSLDDTVR
jgi:hypothetical protein